MPQEPLPSGGWSRETDILTDALIAPAQEMTDPMGVWHGGTDYWKAAPFREGRRVTTPLAAAPVAEEHLSGTLYWGGVYFGHFGHFITETFSRLWAMGDHAFDGLVFMPRHTQLRDFVLYQKELMALLLPDLPVHYIRKPTRVERLIVPGQGFGIGKISQGTPEFVAFAREAFARVPAEGPEKIYISRGRFGGKGGLVGERALEENLVRAGYVPVYPERMSATAQLATFKAAKKIVGLDSSAFHMVAYVAHPDQDICIIQRRSQPAYTHIASHIQSFCGRAPAVVNTLTADWMPAAQKKANHVSWGEWDDVQGAARLRELGFLTAGDEWQPMDDKAFAAALAFCEEKHQSPLVRRAL